MPYNMAAWIPKTVIQQTKNQNVYAASQVIQSHGYSSKPKIIKNPSTASLKRGTGGRSSFNGVVATVFGCSGFYGRYVCNRLGKIGTQMILPYRCDRYHVMPLKLCGDLGQIFMHPFDLRDEESIVKCIKYSNVVINLIGSDIETDNFSYSDVHVEGARRLAKLAKECGVERFIHLSCLNADPKPKPLMVQEGSGILKAKWHGELAVKEEFPDATIIRPSVTYGQEDDFINHYMNPWRRSFSQIPLWKGGKETEKQPVHVSDVAAGIVAAVLDRNAIGKTYQFVGPQRYKLVDLIDWMMQVAAQGNKDIAYLSMDMRYNPLFGLKVLITEITHKLYPISTVTWEVVEKHHTSDTVRKDLPCLEDLGITPSTMESRIAWELKPFRVENTYAEKLGEMVAPPPPKTVPL